MKLPDAVLALKRLDSSGLDLRSRQMVTACGSMSLADFKSLLKRIFGEHSHSTSTGAVTVKRESEVPLFNAHRLKSQKQFTHAKKSEVNLKGTDPIINFGKRTKCTICQSVY